MKGYFLRRLLAIIPTFFGITIIAFIVLNMAPGGPVEQMIRQIRFGSAGKSTSTAAGRAASTARDTGVNQEIIEALQKQYGFDKPVMINTRITDRKVGGIDAIGMVLFDLDPNRSIEMELNPRGTIILPYLVPALLHPKGSDYGLVDLVSKNGLNAIEKKRNVLLTIPILYYPLERQTARIQAGLTSSSDLLTLAMKSDAEERLSLLRTARAMEYMMADSGVLLDWGWRNPISIPFLDWIADMFGPEAVQSPAHLENWWMEYRTTLDDGIIRKSLIPAFDGNPAAREVIRNAGPVSVPLLINAIPELTEPRLSAATNLLQEVSLGEFNIPQYLADDQDLKDSVESWWDDNYLTYVEIGGFQRFIMAFTCTRYGIWLGNILTFDFGQSFTYDQPVMDVIVSKMPVSIQFGVISFFMTYLVCIPLGILKAIRDGTAFDYMSSIILFLMWSIPGFMLAILLIVFFGGGSFFDLIPIGGLYSDSYQDLGLWSKLWDRIHHFIAPLICYMIAEFTTLTLLMKNSIIEEISKDYCRTARAKGLSRKTVYMKHALRNALIPIATGIGGFLGIFFAGSMLLEMIFNLDGMGLLGYTSVLARDFNVIMGDLVIISLIALIGNIISDFIYTIADPRIDFV